jgi:hypothetical protein
MISDIISTNPQYTATLVERSYTMEYFDAAFVVGCGKVSHEREDQINVAQGGACVFWSGIVLFFVGCGVGSLAATMAIALVTAGRGP